MLPFLVIKEMRSERLSNLLQVTQLPRGKTWLGLNPEHLSSKPKLFPCDSDSRLRVVLGTPNNYCFPHEIGKGNWSFDFVCFGRGHQIHIV
jgi:hypothetical protein